MKATCKKCNVDFEEEWKDFIPFYNWALDNGYEEGLYLSRKDKNVGYFSYNLEFVTKKVRKEHGQYNTRLYRIWLGIKQRCHNPNDTGYEHYGARGIEVCQEWYNSFESFYTWSMGHGYNNELTLDRIDFKGNYEPQNCRWVDFDIQANNKETSNLLEIDGVTKTLTQWAEYYNISPVTVFSRYRNGVRGIDLFDRPKLTGASVPKYITIDGETKRASEWSKISGVESKTITNRYKEGVRGKDLIAPRLSRSFEYVVEIDGVSKPLKQWVDQSEVSYDTMLERYKKGLRGKDLLAKREKPENLLVEIDGVTKTLEQWSIDTGINKSTLSSRYHSGKRGKALIRPIRKTIIVEYQNKKQSLNAWGVELGIDPETLRRRYHQGKSGEELFKRTTK